MNAPASPRSVHRWAVISLLAMCLIWGGSFAAMKFALQSGLSVGAMLSLRFTMGALLLGGVLLLLGRRLSREALLDSLKLGLVLSTVFWLQADGLRYTTTAKSGFITGLYVIFTPLVSLLFGQRPRAAHAFGAMAACMGLFLLVHDPSRPFGGWNFGDTETLFCALACGFHIVMTHRYGQRHGGWELAFGQVATVALVSWILTFLIPSQPLPDGSRLGGLEGLGAALSMQGVWISLAYQGVLATTLAFWLMSAFQKYLGATEAAVLYTLEPVFTAFIAMAGIVPGIREHLGPWQIAGGAVILGANLLAELGPRAWERLRKSRR